MKSERRSSAKGKLKLVKITFINRHFLVKKRLLLVEKVLVLFDVRKTSFITTLFYATAAPLLLCAAKLCSQRPLILISLSVKSWNRSEM